MAYTTINKSTDYFNTKLYAGNGGTQSITGVGFQPDLIWAKARDATETHDLVDAVRGNTKYLASPSSGAETTASNGVTAFDNDGFSLGLRTSINGSGMTFATWNWKAGTTSGLSGGTITPSAYSINTTSKFGIYKYQGNGTGGATIAHGLGVKPAFMLIKCTSSTDDIVMYHKKLGATKHLKWRASSRTASTSSAYWNDTEPTTSVFSIGNDSGVNTNGETYVAYVWGEVKGYSYFGEYNGNQQSNEGPFTFTGFRPQFVIICRSNSDDEIEIYDSKRFGYNGKNAHLNANLSSAEDANGGRVHFLSNGFQILTGSSGPTNSSGQPYLTMAWGQSLVGSNNIPNNAR